MRILILDDDKTRHDKYAAVYKRHRVYHAKTYYEFVSCLDRGSPWDLIHLDHDLGDFEEEDFYTDGWGNKQSFNGKHAAARVCELDDHKLPSQVIIQSINPAGAREMKNILETRGIQVSWRPFGDESDL